MLSGTIEEVAEQAGRILSAIAPGAYCVPQEWDRRIDCLIKLPNGRVIGEMVPLDKANEERIREAGERLKQKWLGLNVELHDELKPPIQIGRLSN